MSMSSLFSMHPLSQCCMSILYHRLPLDIDVIEMLCPLSRDEVSAHNIHTLLSEVTWYTEDLAPHELAGNWIWDHMKGRGYSPSLECYLKEVCFGSRYCNHVTVM